MVLIIYYLEANLLKRFSKEEIRTLLNIAGREGAFNEIENTRLQNVMDFEQLKVKDVDTTPVLML